MVSPRFLPSFARHFLAPVSKTEISSLMRNSLQRMALWSALILLFGVSDLAAKTPSIRRQYPFPNSVEVNLGTNIGITAISAYDASSLKAGSVSVNGSISGIHAVNLTISRDRQTLIIHPVKTFSLNERVHVLINVRLLGGEALTDTFGFTTMRRVIPTAQAL